MQSRVQCDTHNFKSDMQMKINNNFKVQDPLEKFTIIHLVKKFPAFMEPDSHHCIHKSQSLNPMLS